MEFESTAIWDDKFSGVKFAGSIGGKRYMFAISRAALIDFFQTADTKEQALLNFEENRSRFERLATRRVVEEKLPHDDGPVVITYLICIEYQL
ncbi:DUF1488 family protein [Zhongshania aliphaticivorans]|uniref:DUF1488 family protein n=1 Tax=Zhongshania aliphaticivorans TaxID=1470434 RepID=UPI0012E57C7B|nr:DUF1488 family protein [Zhongshania aliphaticivorans]CAA0082712.1 Uncharacterised protein [Zhongshania aliphaticivorans]